MRTRTSVVILIALALVWLGNGVMAWITGAVGDLQASALKALSTVPPPADDGVLFHCAAVWTEVGRGEMLGLMVLFLAGPPLTLAGVIGACVRGVPRPKGVTATLAHAALVVQHAALIAAVCIALTVAEYVALGSQGVDDLLIAGPLGLCVLVNVGGIAAWRQVVLRTPRRYAPLLRLRACG